MGRCSCSVPTCRKSHKETGFFFTYHSYDIEHLAYDWLSLGVACAYYSEELGENNDTPHLQGFFIFPTKEDRSSDHVLKDTPFKGSYCARLASLEDAINYVQKEKGPDYLFGTLPDPATYRDLKRKKNGCARNAPFVECLDLARKGDIDLIRKQHPALYTRYANLYISEAGRAYNREPRPHLCDIYLWGAPGTGKTTAVKALFGADECMVCTYSGQFFFIPRLRRIMVLDEMSRRQYLEMGPLFNQLCDHDAVNLNVKGSSYYIRPEVVVIISNQTPEEFFIDTSVNNPAMRRVKCVELTLQNRNQVLSSLRIAYGKVGVSCAPPDDDADKFQGSRKRLFVSAFEEALRGGSSASVAEEVEDGDKNKDSSSCSPDC